MKNTGLNSHILGIHEAKKGDFSSDEESAKVFREKEFGICQRFQHLFFVGQHFEEMLTLEKKSAFSQILRIRKEIERQSCSHIAQVRKC